ncbi:Pimeloyl-ACP methyl ester carboxylesterase [Palleronia marisminoris]|uniref:Esterase YbfF n=1 Tax=Palleronia marisminoris TaxID=315423 RepID=A0A1Y5S0M2_9RHOB|nr:alpha/beta fold hydrolase [Palleronia marisminoris]SFG43186.1 Pimeloyl-ACP methyl ester carboxylesterase [Palleronia marisminoris]SLN27265.1 Esterase YbfF [Palleronia marisminoris]
MKLETTISGPEGAPALLIAHGLFGSARNWGVIQKRLSDSFRVTAVDMRNHGDSGWSDDHSYEALAGDLAETLSGPSHVMGHSMGGKAAMALALRHPDLVDRLIVADIAPVAYTHTQAHLVEAMKSLDLDAINTRRDADEMLAEHVETKGVRAFLLQSLDVQNRRWQLNLDVLEREMPGIVGWPGLSGSFPGPALFLSGADSDYVTPDSRPAIRDLFPKARFASIPDAGHWLHAEKPRETEAAIRAFLDRGAD